MERFFRLLTLINSFYLKPKMIMAEIKIEKKPPVWPWILLGLLLLGGLIYWFTVRDNDRDTLATDATDSAETMATGDMGNTEIEAVAEYVAFVEGDTEAMGLDHEYTNEALKKLTAATEAVASQQNYDINADMGQVREYAGKVATDPYETSHANSIRKAADLLAGSLHKIQEAKFPALPNEAQSVVDAANKIDPDVLTLDQKPAVKGFFGEAASLLSKMN